MQPLVNDTYYEDNFVKEIGGILWQCTTKDIVAGDRAFNRDALELGEGEVAFFEIGKPFAMLRYAGSEYKPCFSTCTPDKLFKIVKELF